MVVFINGVVMVNDCVVVVGLWLSSACFSIFDIDCGKFVNKAVAGSFLTFVIVE
jgi:hypothetical protein